MASSKKAILLIEDNPLLTGLYSAGFKKKGFEVLVVHNGEEGLKIIQKERPDIVVLDLFMPGMTGIEVLQKIRENPEIKDTKVVVLTISTKDEDKKKVKELGVLDYLVKQELHLTEIVERVLSHLK